MEWYEKIKVIPTLVVITYFILLFVAIFMITSFYFCDNQNCRSFEIAFTKEGSKNQALALLEIMCHESIWSIAYIASSILTPLTLWLLGAPITLKNYSISFILGLFVFYMITSYVIHHYYYPITSYVSEYIIQSCPASNPPEIIQNKYEGITFIE